MLPILIFRLKEQSTCRWILIHFIQGAIRWRNPGKGLASYNTSICMMALMQAKQAEFEPIIEKARRFLINQQSDFDSKGKVDTTFDGGIGYGSTWAHSDLSNTHLAMEALFYAKKSFKSKDEDKLELDWDAVISFVSKCQNLKSRIRNLGSAITRTIKVASFIFLATVWQESGNLMMVKLPCYYMEA